MNDKIRNAYNKTAENFNFAEKFLQNYFEDETLKLNEHAVYLSMNEIEKIFAHCKKRYNKLDKNSIIAAFQDHDFFFEYECIAAKY